MHPGSTFLPNVRSDTLAKMPETFGETVAEKVGIKDIFQAFA